MPVHNWSRVDSGIFHHFHQDWTIEIARALNRGRLPAGYSALAEQRAAGLIPDVLTLHNRAGGHAPSNGGVATMPMPQTRFVRRTGAEIDAERGNRIVIRHALGEVVAAIEIISPGNKASRSALRAFVDKTVEFLRKGVHVLIVDLFRPSSRDPHGIHKAVWDEILEEPFELPPDKPLTLVSYRTGAERTAFIEPVAVGDRLPDMPVFLSPDVFVWVPLETTYQSTWEACPADLRSAVETGLLSGDEQR